MSTGDERHISFAADRPGPRQLDRLTGLERIRIREIHLSRGDADVVRHAGAREDAFVYVLSGRGVLKSGPERADCGAGDFVAVTDAPPDVPLVLENTGPEPLICLAGTR